MYPWTEPAPNNNEVYYASASVSKKTRDEFLALVNHRGNGF